MSPNPPTLPTETLAQLKLRENAVVTQVRDAQGNDPIARRLRELGFVPGEPIRIVATGPLGGEPVLVQVGFTRFALRRAEAQRIHVQRTRA